MPRNVIATASDDDAKFVFDEWHRATTSRDVDALIALYADRAVMETPMAALLLGRPWGDLNGKGEVAQFLRANFQRRQSVIESMEAVRFFRTGEYQFNGRTLTWEYLRKTPGGDSFDVCEVLELDRRMISAHRIYLGWFAFQHLVRP